jgi:hypothetical protein
MKTSNKILLGGLLTILLVLLAVDVAIYARYKAGNYIPFSESEKTEATQVKEFPNDRSIDIRFLTNVVVRIGDRMKVEQFEDNNGKVVLTEKGGRVELSLKDSIGADRFFNYVIIYVPENTTISTYKAYVKVEGQEGTKIHHLNFMASGGQIAFSQAKNMLQIDSLSVDAANQATIDLENARIHKMTVQLNASELNDNGAIIQELKLNADSASRINLQYKNLSNLINKATAHE